MKALLSEAPGGPQTLSSKDIDTPEPAPGEIRIRMEAVGVNYPDMLIIEDRYQIRPERPFAPGGEVAGTVEAIGADVTGFSIGDRVMAVPLHGMMAESVCVKAALCHRFPDDMPFETAASLQMTYGTALYALAERGACQPGENVLVLGAAGGVGLAAVELAKALGARVVAAASSKEKVAIAVEHGAENGIVYPKGDLDKQASKSLGTAFKSAFGGEGPDIVVDIVGGAYSEPALRSLRWEGRHLVVGFPAGIASIPLNLPLLKSCDIRGIFWGEAVSRDPDAHHAAMDRLIEFARTGAIKPRIHATYPLAEGAEAIAALGSRGIIGKVVVVR
ncbi:NADPH:quinone oxidoreductase family protein [Fulvimarina sp. MAC3]|uniref:NADPH:quinone oxidoreductase family protein n=1 Tax=Fulvimarina sp. MAC3 TaxID=3148887 RepID=UPI0031FDAADC